MTTTNFETGTVITKEWLNDVDAAVYETLPTKVDTSALSSKANAGVNTDITSLEGPIAIKADGGGSTSFTLSGTNNISTSADIIGADTNFGISSLGSTYIFLDSDNNSTSSTFTVATNAPGTSGATTVFEVTEAGNALIPGSLNITGDINTTGSINRVETGQDSVTTFVDVSTHGNVMSGWYTPTVTPITNVTSATASAQFYFRVGLMVTIFGNITIDPSSASGPTEITMSMSLPIASNFTTSRHAGGTATNRYGDTIAIYADIASDLLYFNGTVSDITNRTYYYTLSYVIN